MGSAYYHDTTSRKRVRVSDASKLPPHHPAGSFQQHASSKIFKRIATVILGGHCLFYVLWVLFEI